MDTAVKGTRPILALAAQSVATVSGVDQTAVDVLRGRAFGHYAEALHQYMAVRFSNVDDATEALPLLRARAGLEPSDEIVQPPGLRARLFRLARELARERRAELRSPVKVPWRQLHADFDAVLCDRVRVSLSPPHAELLELRHARELTDEEVAFVLNLSGRDYQVTLHGAWQALVRCAGQPMEPEQLAELVATAFSLGSRDDSVEIDVDDPDGLASGIVLGDRYEVRERVGFGAFSDVYKASDTEVPGHVVALKLLHQRSLSQEARAAAIRELHLIASVFHPSIVQFKDHGWHDSRLWFVMPWYEGESLEARIGRQPLTRAEARHIFEALARALATMHAMGVRHQDVKPDNIFLTRLRGYGMDEHGEVLPVLLDLGVAAKEAEMVIAGTPGYFAPEVAARFTGVGVDEAITAKADVFSLALTLRDALDPDGRDDVVGGAVERFIMKRAQGVPEPPNGRGQSFLRPHFKRWLSFDPDKRPTADELANELSVLTRPEDARRRRRQILRWLAPLLLGLGAVFGAALFGLNQRAELRRMEAQRARTDATVARADLRRESGLRRDLEEDVARIEDRYRESRLTRRELATKLGRTEGALRGEQRRHRSTRESLTEAQTEGERVLGELRVSQADLATARGTLTTAQAELTSTRQALMEMGDALGAERDRASALDTRLARADRALGEARQEAQGATARALALEAQVAELRLAQSSQRERLSSLQAGVAAAEAARDAALLQLREARRRNTALSARPASSPEPPAAPGPAPPPEAVP